MHGTFFAATKYRTQLNLLAWLSTCKVGFAWICLYTFRFASSAAQFFGVCPDIGSGDSVCHVCLIREGIKRKGGQEDIDTPRMVATPRIIADKTHSVCHVDIPWVKPVKHAKKAPVPRVLGALASPLASWVLGILPWQTAPGGVAAACWLIRMDQPPLILVIAIGPLKTPQKAYF